ncbi:PIN domain-containing protein [Pseudomonas sp. HR96]|uniref:PIN domain-containing protein n=1 Tax=Pseudomonas sp. HR96 TaxID=1027966 RepID=UPI002A74ED11|nr:PIN domain-containing protein [Pseudomonas sp. HR96]WPO99806.1 PIN domain-containing protein [Pseudomonas sp. HR96]
MIVLDTNVISELIKDRPHARVLNWVNEQAADDLAITSITVAEILYGIALARG